MCLPLAHNLSLMTEKIEITTEERILEAAKNVFILRGLDGARMQDIADEAGINKAMLHYYFRSKDGLFEKVFDSISGKIIPDLTVIIEQDLPIVVILDRVIHRYIDFVSENPKLPLFLISELTKDPERIENLLRHTQNFSKMQHFGVKLMDAMQAGTIKQVHPLHLILNILSMCIFPFLAQPMLQQVMKISDEDYALVLNQRKEQVSLFIHAALKV
jgi:TetR/AcrR family transcriptional regulator